MEPQIRYAKTSDGVNIAWYALGSGPPYVWPGAGGAGVADLWRVPETRSVFEGIAQRATLVVFDLRGFGLSDRGPMDFSCDAIVRDFEAVTDAAAPGQFTLQTFGQMSMPALAYAGQHPERVRALVLLNGVARGIDMSGRAKQLLRLAEDDWDYAVALLARANEASYSSAATLEQSEEIFKRSTPKEAFIAFGRAVEAWDVTEIVGLVQTPAVVVHYTQSLNVPREACRRLAATLPNATFVSAEAGDGGGTRLDHVRTAVVDFLRALPRAERPRQPSSRLAGSGTAVILFTDIAGSAALTERMGDAAFRTLARSLDERVRAAIRDNAGSAVEGTLLGDGVMGVFTSAAQAIAAARACLELGGDLPMHIGLHAGDVISEGDNVYGGSVNIASRICGLCEAGEILVSSTVRDLARTSAGVSFDDRGEHVLKGIGDPVRVFAVQSASR